MESWEIYANYLKTIFCKYLFYVKSLVQVQQHQPESTGHLNYQQPGDVMAVPGLLGKAWRTGAVQTF